MASKGNFKLSIDPQAQNMMFALLGGEGKTEEQIVDRCSELCGLIEQVHKEHPDYNLGQILEEASTHCESQNEVTFLGYVLGTKVGAAKGHMEAQVEQQLRSLFEELQHAHRGHSFSMS